MKSRTKLLVVVVATAMTILWFAIPGGREPVYRGKSLGEWAGGLSSDDPEEQKRSRDAINAIGPRAVAYLRSELHRRHSKTDDYKLRIREVLDWIGIHWDPRLSEDKRWAALRICRNLRPTDASLIPELEFALTNTQHFVIITHWDEQKEAALALAAMGRKSIPTLVRAANAQDSSTRYGVAIGLGDLTESEPAAIETLIKLTADPASEVRLYASISPCKQNQPPEVWQPSLIESLSSKGGEVDWYSLDLVKVASLGPRGKPLIPKLLEMTTSTNELVRTTANDVILGIDPTFGSKAKSE